MFDVARLGLAVDSSQVEKGTATLHQLTGAAGQASAAAQRLAGATNVEAAGHKAAAAAAQAHNAALMAQNTVIRSSMQQRTMMIYQLNDIGVSLASGMNPAMVAIQQGSQILQGGFAPALRTITDLIGGLVTKFWPLMAAVGAVAGAFAGLAYEFNKTGETQVSMIDVAIAGWQMFAETVTNLVSPVFSAIGGWLAAGWNAAAPVLKTAGNAIIGAFVGAFDAVKATWSLLPAAIGDLVIQAANGVVGAVEGMINKVAENINGFIRNINGAIMMIPENMRGGWTGIGEVDPVNLGRVPNPNEGAAAGAVDAATGAFSGAQRDYLGGIGSAWDARAEQIALARKETEELGGAAKAANDNVKKLADDGMTKAFDVAKGLASAFQGVGKGIFDAFKKGGDIASSVLEMLMGKLEQFATSWLDNIVNNGIDALFSSFGSFGIGSGMGGVSSITGSSGGFFPAFDGGGFTGSGSRSGGLDGKGGFMAMLHPNETVLDHTRGQAANSNRPISVQTNIINNAGVEVIERTTDDGQGGVRQEIILNRAVAQQIAKPGAANSAVRGVGRITRR